MVNDDKSEPNKKYNHVEFNAILREVVLNDKEKSYRINVKREEAKMLQPKKGELFKITIERVGVVI